MALGMLLWANDKAASMATDLEELREIERLLRDAEARLEAFGTFRQRTLLRMTVFEVQRSLRAQEQAKQQSDPPQKMRDDSVR